MAVVELSKEQIFDLVRQMAPAQQREMLLWLAQSGPQQRAQRQEFAEAQLRRLCAERGRAWDAMSADERESFIDDLMHEDRQCAP